jgi:hypothetical protein
MIYQYGTIYFKKNLSEKYIRHVYIYLFVNVYLDFSACLFVCVYIYIYV